MRTFDLSDDDIRHPGTSFSTPAVTRIVSDLACLMQEEFDPLLLKALTIHSAKYPAGIQMKMSEKINQMGFGVPAKAHDILYNSSDEITLILRDSLEKGSFIEMAELICMQKLITQKAQLQICGLQIKFKKLQIESEKLKRIKSFHRQRKHRST